MYPKKTFDFFPEIKFLEKVIRKYLKEEGAPDRIPRMDRLMDCYRLLLWREGEKKIKAPLAKELGVAVLLYASAMPDEERQELLLAHKIEGLGKNVSSEIRFALEDCLRMKKSYAQNLREVELPRNVLGSLLSLLVHMEELGEGDTGLFSLLESLAAEGKPFDLYGNIPADQLRDMAGLKMLKDSTEKRLEGDGSAVAAAILLVLKTKYYIAPVKSFLNEEMLAEINMRRACLKTEAEKLIRKKMKDEKSMSL